MIPVRLSACALVFAFLSSCAAQTSAGPGGPIQFNKPQPTFPLTTVDPPDFGEPVSGPGNAILVQDRGQRGQSPKRAPLTISRTFARGEFAECVQAAFAGVPVETQCDVKTRWTDGSLRHALVSFWIELNDNAHAQIDFLPAPCVPEAAGLSKEEMLAFLNGGWDAILAANASLDGSAPLEQSVSAREILRRWNGVENPTGIRYWMRGPIATQIILEDRSPETPFDFGWSHTLPAVQLDGQISATATSIKTRATSGTAFEKWRFPALVSGRSEYILVCGADGPELRVCPNGRGALGTRPAVHNSNSYLIPNQGWSIAANLAQKSLHPIFVVTFYPGWEGVKIEAILENVWLDRIQDQQYSVRIHAGSPDSPPVYQSPGLIQQSGARWRKTFWQGSQPAPLRIDHNLPYLIHSRVVPSFDLSFQFRHEVMHKELARFNQSDRGEPLGIGLWQPYMHATAGRHDIGLLPGWYVHLLYTWDANQYDLFLGQAAVSGHAPTHFREPADSAREFEPYHRSPAAGRVVSIDARPTFFAYGPPPFQRSETLRDERGVQVGPLSQSEWSVDNAHQPGIAYLPYALTGDWYFLEELHFWSSSWLAYGHPSVCFWCRLGSAGLFTGQLRGQAWTLRSLAHATVMTPDSMPEHTYFYAKLRNNIALREGLYNVKGGTFFAPEPECASPCTNSLWRAGRDIVGQGRENPLYFLEEGSSAGVDRSAHDVTKLGGAGAPWVMNFMHAVFGLVEELGFGEITPLRRTVAANLISQIRHPDYNPYLADVYRIPTLDVDGNLMKSWGAVLDAFLPPYRNRTAFPGLSMNCSDCYAATARGTSSWMAGITTPDGLSGTEAFLFLYRTIPTSAALRADPKWAIVPRTPVEGLPQARLRAPSWFKAELARLALSRR